jgi:O-antigen/teichoic acid export membrane protein
MAASESERPTAPDGTTDVPHLRNMAGTAGLRLTALALGFVTNVVLARILGVGEYGVLSYVLAWVGLLSAIGIFGLDRLLVREVSVYNGQAAWGFLRGLLGWAHMTALSISLGIAGLVIYLGGHVISDSNSGLTLMLPAAGFFLICIVMVRISGSALQGFHRIVGGQLAETVVQPGICLVLIAIAGILWHWRLIAPQILTLYLIAAGLACMFNGWQLGRALPDGVRSSRGQYESRVWLAGALPLLLISALEMLNRQTSMLILGAFAGTEALGTYAAADRLAQLVIFPLTVVNLTLAPSFATLYQAGNRVGLQRLVTKSARLVLMTSTPIALALILGSHWFLLLFGSGFTGGRTPLTILCVGQLINAAIGSVGYLLIMTGHGREAAVGIGIGAIANLVFGPLLIPWWGASGAAAAAAISLTLWNVALAVFVRRRTGILTTAFNRIAP